VQGQILAEYAAGAWGYVLPDHLPASAAAAWGLRRHEQVGSVRTETDTLGRMTTSCSFNPFGVPLGADGGSFNDEVHTALSR
jgi:hypothetical protein